MQGIKLVLSYLSHFPRLNMPCSVHVMFRVFWVHSQGPGGSISVHVSRTQAVGFNSPPPRPLGWSAATGLAVIELPCSVSELSVGFPHRAPRLQSLYE